VPSVWSDERAGRTLSAGWGPAGAFGGATGTLHRFEIISLNVRIYSWHLFRPYSSESAYVFTSLCVKRHEAERFLATSRLVRHTEGMIRQLLEPREEVLSGRLQSVIDLERVADPRRRALESRPRDFLGCTYVSGEVRRFIEALDTRLNSSSSAFSASSFASRIRQIDARSCSTGCSRSRLRRHPPILTPSVRDDG
jgi:hypothetical protein